MPKRDRRVARLRRHRRVRKKVLGSSSRPRLAVFRSSRHIYAQLIDDMTATTLVSAASVEPVLRSASADGGKVGTARSVGELLASRALEKGIEQVVFDRGGYQYHGRLASLAEAAREGGLKF